MQAARVIRSPAVQPSVEVELARALSAAEPSVVAAARAAPRMSSAVDLSAAARAAPRMSSAAEPSVVAARAAPRMSSAVEPSVVAAATRAAHRMSSAAEPSVVAAARAAHRMSSAAEPSVAARAAHRMSSAAEPSVAARAHRMSSAAEPSVEWIQASYHADHLQGMALVFAAATPAVNDRVALDAIRRGVWVNSATDPTAGDFTLPAVVRRGELVIAASTGGAAPALARRIREKLEAEFDEAFATWIRLLETIRPLVRERVADPERRRALLDAFADWPWLDRLRAEGEAKVWEEMQDKVRG